MVGLSHDRMARVNLAAASCMKIAIEDNFRDLPRWEAREIDWPHEGIKVHQMPRGHETVNMHRCQPRDASNNNEWQ